nr:alpha-galactosidase [Planctomycetota bacterium]
GFDGAIAALTRHRRAIRRPNRHNVALPVIFNDYMNCLMGEPTTAKLLPLIDAAADMGCEYFCVDAGWYADGGWWDNVGEWLPSAQRFPGGIEEVLKRILARGMVPGLWLELEVMGIKCPLASKVPDDWFFVRHGKRIIDHGRYQLDYRNPAVRAHADAVIERLVTAWGVGYIKMDYNINAGIGTEVAADSPGAGLLGHNRAYLAWLDAVFQRHPDLVIENCSSGGMRMDYALLARHSIQSSSDQMDYRKNAIVAASTPSGVTPEQNAVWSYPLRDADRETAAVNMVNALLGRIHQSGHLAELGPDARAMVAEGIACYKRIRAAIPAMVPYWPIGTPVFGDGWAAIGLRGEAIDYLAVWRLEDSSETQSLPIAHLVGREVAVELLYPANAPCNQRWSAANGNLVVTLPVRTSARLFALK